MFAFLLDPLYWRELGFYAAIVVIEALGAWWEGWLFPSQVRRRQPVPEKFLDLWRHMGIQFDFWVVNPTIAFVTVMHGAGWNALTLGEMEIAVAIICLPVVKAWVDDPVPSALARNGSVTIPGGILHFFYMPVMISRVVMYYTQPAYVRVPEVCIITAILMGHWGVGLIQPAWLVHYKGRGLPLTRFFREQWMAFVLTAGGWLVLVGAAVRLIYFI
jgi:hypothetical protein